MTKDTRDPQTLAAAPGVTVPEANKKPGVHYIPTAEGWELPVIDMLHPAFDDIPTRPGWSNSLGGTWKSRGISPASPA